MLRSTATVARLTFKRSLHQKPKKGFAAWYRKQWGGSPSDRNTMYQHLVQLGDPCLRQQALSVRPEDVRTDEIQQLIANLKNMLTLYDTLGVSAPQVGVSAQVSVVSCSQAQVDAWPEEAVTERRMKAFDTRVLINPTLRIIDSGERVLREGCGSMYGFSALVPRAAAVKVTALDESGREFTWSVRDWTARIVQHEVDHLHGVLFVDKALPETLEFAYWSTVNARGGDFRLSYSGIKGVKHRLFPFNLVK